MTREYGKTEIFYGFGKDKDQAFADQLSEELKGLGVNARVSFDPRYGVSATVFRVEDGLALRMVTNEWRSEAWHITTVNGGLQHRIDGPARTARYEWGEERAFYIYGDEVSEDTQKAAERAGLGWDDLWYWIGGVRDGVDKNADFAGPVWKRWPTLLVAGSGWQAKCARVIAKAGLECRAKVAAGPKLRGQFAVVFDSLESLAAFEAGMADQRGLDHFHNGRRSVIPPLGHYEPKFRMLANEDGRWPWEAADTEAS